MGYGVAFAEGSVWNESTWQLSNGFDGYLPHHLISYASTFHIRALLPPSTS